MTLCLVRCEATLDWEVSMESSRALTRACRSLTLVVATAALALGISGVASAATTSSTAGGNTVTFAGDPGEFNSVNVGYDTASPGGPWIVVQDTDRQTVDNHAAGSGGCTNTNPQTSSFDGSDVWCPAAGITSLVLNGNDGDDNLNGVNGVGPFTGGNFAPPTFPPSVGFLFDGGDGNDGVILPVATTTNGVGPSGTAFGGNGNDGISVVDGQTANGGPGDDTLNAGGTFAGEKRPFGGAILNGDAGQDQLNGSPAITSDHLNGGDDNDVLFPGAGPEDLIGGNGGDVVNWFNGGGAGNGVNVSLDNVANDGSNGQGANAHSDIETLLGTGATDALTGAPGVANFVDGFGGNDLFNVASNPADPDVVVCGDGFVTINADARDVFDTVGPTACRGQINKPPVASGVTLKIRSSSTKIDSDGEVAVKIGCRGTGTCRGVLQVDKNGTVLGTAQFVVPSGSTKRVSFLPRPAYAKRLKAGKTVKATATADATDSGGATGSATGTVTIHGKKHKK